MASNVRRCDLCNSYFEIHEYTYRSIQLPRLDDSGRVASGNQPRSVVNTEKYDVCWECLTFLRDVMKSMQTGLTLVVKPIFEEK